MTTTIIASQYDALDALWSRSYPGLRLSSKATRGSYHPQRKNPALVETAVRALLDHPGSAREPDGESWRAGLERDQPWRNPDRLDRHLDILLEVCDAMAFAHSRGILHLDLKPDKVTLGEHGEVWVLGWELARELGEGEGGAPKASDLQEPCGTPCFMPPELALGNGARIDERSEVYLLGGLLCLILSGEPPNRGESLGQVLFRAAEGPPPELGHDVPEEARSIVAQALASSPDERFEDVPGFAEALRGFRARRGLADKDNRSREYAIQGALRRGLLYAAIALLALLVCAVQTGRPGSFPQGLAPAVIDGAGSELVGIEAGDLVHYDKSSGARTVLAARLTRAPASMLLALAPQRGLLATAERRGDEVRLWDLKARRELTRLAGQGSLQGLAFDASGRLAVWSSEGLRVYEAAVLLTRKEAR